MVGGGYYEMTKKFWNDWQKRVYETYTIDLYESVKVNKEFFNRWNLLNHVFADDKIINATFNGDSVDLVIEQYRWVFKKNGLRMHPENLYITLERTNIKSIEFKKKYSVPVAQRQSIGLLTQGARYHNSPGTQK